MSNRLKVLVAGCGNMGASHARAYHKMPEFEIVGLVSRGPASRGASARNSVDCPSSATTTQALAATKPDVVSINTYPETHAPYAKAAHRGRLPRVLREAAGRDRRRGAGASSMPRAQRDASW